MTALERTDHFAAAQRHAADSIGSENNNVRYHYQLQVEPESDSLCRILNLFALQCLLPHGVQMRQQADLLQVEIAIDGLSWHRAQLIAQKMRNLICVCEVVLRTALLSNDAPGKTLQSF
ncbi:hypothetical protein [Pseudomonas japonica]|uniref:Uncharacterized protein n=1 Tax=Pseudomonas japonica TaxID=256466 RepID=A0A239CBS7_9PSED|nr:hypothetical protein [Pseudomonas japonica]SNS17560.1 hypothetical protein SAMN05444352_104111 [Pseudomonas japonica]